MAEELSCFEEVMVVRVVRSGVWAEADVGCLVVDVVDGRCSVEGIARSLKSWSRSACERRDWVYWTRAVILRFSESGSAVSKSTETSWMPGYPALSISW